MTRKKKRSLGIFGSKIGREVLINLSTFKRKALPDLPSLKKIKNMECIYTLGRKPQCKTWRCHCSISQTYSNSLENI
jgi:hypothetical protein